MQFPVLDFGLDQYGSEPFNLTTVTIPHTERWCTSTK